MGEKTKDYPWYWWIRKQLQSTCYYIKYWLRRCVRNRRIGLVLSGATGFYGTLWKFFRFKWTFFTAIPEIHENLFLGIVGLTAFSYFIRAFIGDENQPLLKKSGELLRDLISTVGRIVQEKKIRFRRKLEELDASEDKFNAITRPRDQIESIFIHASDFLQSSFGLKDDEIDFTIMYKNSIEGEWKYLIKHQSWAHKDPNVVTNAETAASICLETNEYLFFPDKISAAKSGQYKLSRRDTNRKWGSAFFMPVAVKAKNFDVVYLISILTYGKQFCLEADKETTETAAAFLKEICRRIELELFLETVKMVK